MCCSMLHRGTVLQQVDNTKWLQSLLFRDTIDSLQCVAVCWSVLQCVAVCCNKLTKKKIEDIQMDFARQSDPRNLKTIRKSFAG